MLDLGSLQWKPYSSQWLHSSHDFWWPGLDSSHDFWRLGLDTIQVDNDGYSTRVTIDDSRLDSECIFTNLWGSDGQTEFVCTQQMSIFASVMIRIGENFLFCLSGRFMLHFRDDHYSDCRLDIRQVSEFATGSGYPKTAFKWEPDTHPDIRNAFIDISRFQTFGKTCAFHNHSFIIFRSIFSAFCALTPSQSTG